MSNKDRKKRIKNSQFVALNMTFPPKFDKVCLQKS